MQQGDQYSIRVCIKKEGVALAPADIVGLKIKVGNIEDSYPAGNISYDSESGKWLFPVTQEQTIALEGVQLAQVQVNFGGNPAQIVGSKVQSAYIDSSVIRSIWNAD